MTETTTLTTRERLREKIVDAMLPHIAFDGWSTQSAREAARDLGLPYSEVERVFPDGTAEMADAFFAIGDRRFREAMAGHKLDNLRVRDRITFAIRERLAQDEPHREAARRALSLLMLPTSGGRAPHALARTVDQIWRAIGDTSTDVNFYTKRATLAGVYSSTYLVWLSDNGKAQHGEDPYAETWAFLDRRIDNVMSFEKAKGRLSAFAERLPDPVGIAARLRYPGKRFAAKFPWPTETGSLNSR